MKGVGGGHERGEREEPPRASIATSFIYVCAQHKHLGRPLQKRREDESLCAVTKHNGKKYVTDSPGGYSQEDLFFFLNN